MAITMKDVARHANLSLGTVSNYVNGKASVSNENKLRIEESIRALDYKVNEAARSLKTKSHRTIGVLIPTFGNVFLVKIVNCIEQILREANYAMLVLSYNGDIEEEKKLMRYLSQRCDGIIYAPATAGSHCVNVFKEVYEKTPIAVLNEKLDGVVSDSVLIDNREASNDAVTALINKGHEKIGLICGPMGFHTTRQRVMGYREAHVYCGKEVSEELIKYSDYSRTEGKRLCGELLDNHKDVTAIFVAGYRMTLGVISEIATRKLSDKIAVIGFDAEDIEDILNPKLSYVDQPFKEMAEQVVKLVLKRVNKDFDGFPTAMKLEASIKNIDSIINV